MGWSYSWIVPTVQHNTQHGNGTSISIIIILYSHDLVSANDKNSKLYILLYSLQVWSVTVGPTYLKERAAGIPSNNRRFELFCHFSLWSLSVSCSPIFYQDDWSSDLQCRWLDQRKQEVVRASSLQQNDVSINLGFTLTTPMFVNSTVYSVRSQASYSGGIRTRDLCYFRAASYQLDHRECL